MPEISRGARTNGAVAKMTSSKENLREIESAANGSRKSNGIAPKLEKRQSHSSAQGDVGKEKKDKNKDSPKKRRKVNHACIYCRRSHMTCDLDRPCNRCIKRNIGHLCHDEPREAIKKSKSQSEGLHTEDGQLGQREEFSPDQPLNQLDEASVNNSGSDLATPALPQSRNGNNGPNLVQPTPVTAAQASGMAGNNAMLGFNDWANSSHINNFQDMHNFHPSYMFNTSEVSAEYNLINDFLSNSLLEDGALYTNEDMQPMFTDQGMPNVLGPMGAASLFPQGNQSSSNQMLPPSQVAAGNAISRPASGFPLLDKNREAYYLTAADPAGNESAEERMNKLLKAKHDAGMLRPFNYVKGYARLDAYMKSHFQPGSRARILRQLDRFRPKFRERTQSLTDLELVMVEMWFERSLMEYDRVFASMAIPACCWRRTGEIFRGNREMADLLHVPTEKLREGQVSIHDIMVESSLVSYWEKFGAIAFDNSQKAILTSCLLKNPVENSKDPNLQCCFSFTIKRDFYNIPTIIVGNFLPIKDN